MTNISEESALILNLRNTAIDHKKHCKRNCCVSLYSIKQAAIYIRNGLIVKRNLNDSEVKQANKYINEMPLS